MDRQTNNLIEIAKQHGLKPAKRWRGGRFKLRKLLVTVAAASGPLLGMVSTTYEIAYDKSTKTMLGARVAEHVTRDGIQSHNSLYAYTTFIYLTTTGSNSWPVPADWNNADNKIECIGGGGNGGAAGQSGTALSWSGGGGGGGAYATDTNVTLTPGGTASYSMNVAANTNFASLVIADAGNNSGSNQNAGAGGAAASCTPTTGAASGQAGSAGSAASGTAGNKAGGGGGDARGPTGLGTGWTTPSVAGAGQGGNATAAGANFGNPGGFYGGGGGGGGRSSSISRSGGAGRQGIIRISYTPAAGGVQFRARIIF
jgi:hypothetical protein